ncbi:MAG TPA: hypothetical protein VFE23_19135 [Usitatibacter sp.]|nr:hypothetical protein [Usitatibacter sp.]
MRDELFEVLEGEVALVDEVSLCVALVDEVLSFLFLWRSPMARA